MASRKPSGVKKRLLKAAKTNSPVPTWVMVKTKRRVRNNPQRRRGRKGKLDLK